jgi:hypothetical protein
MQPNGSTRVYDSTFFALCHRRFDLAAYLVIIARSFGNIFNDVLYLTNMVIIVGHCGSYSADRNIRPQAEGNGRQKKLSDTIHETSPSCSDCGRRKKNGPMRNRPASGPSDSRVSNLSPHKVRPRRTQAARTHSIKYIMNQQTICLRLSGSIMTASFVRNHEHDFGHIVRELKRPIRRCIGAASFESSIDSNNSVALSTALALDNRSIRLGAHQSGSARTL